MSPGWEPFSKGPLMLLVQFALVVLLELVHLGQIVKTVVRHKCLTPGAECKGLRDVSNEKGNECRVQLCGPESRLLEMRPEVMRKI